MCIGSKHQPNLADDFAKPL
jgi:hypothetical protein